MLEHQKVDQMAGLTVGPKVALTAGQKAGRWVLPMADRSAALKVDQTAHHLVVGSAGRWADYSAGQTVGQKDD
jgi:hypothetical protein